MQITMNKKSNSLLSDNMPPIDLNILRDGKILTPENTLDPMFLLALEFSTKLTVLEDSLMKNNPTFEEILQVGIGTLLHRMNIVSDEELEDYIKTVVVLVQRQSDSSIMSKKFAAGARDTFDFYR